MRNYNPPTPPDVLFSRRRPGRRRAAANQTRLPDWVWGAGFGAIIVLFIGAYFLLTQAAGGGGSATCDEALPRLPGTTEVNAEGFIEEDAALGRVAGFLEANDRNAADALFYGPVHAFTHNVDPDLREIDEDLAKSLCRAVIDLETALEPQRQIPNPEIAADVQRVQELLRDTAEVLGFPRPG